MEYILDFERPVFELENQIKELKNTPLKSSIDLSKEIAALQMKVDEMVKDIYGKLSPWERVQLSRHPLRPHYQDYLEHIVEDFHEICGDRKFADDQAVIAGFGRIGQQKVAIVGIEKGRKTNEKIKRNFGMPRPEGYRKALRLMELAAQFKLPLITFVDTPGAYPGIEAEERGQSQAIAENIAQMFSIKTPIISVIIGEGGSGGALGIAVADRVLMMEYSIYSVISPESCASILWSDPKKGDVAANALKLTPQMAIDLKVADGMIKEPIGGAHRHPQKMYQMMKDLLIKEVELLKQREINNLLEERFKKFRQMGNMTITKDEEDHLEIFGQPIKTKV